MTDLYLLDLKSVCGMIGVSKSTLYKMIREGVFPKACQVAPNTVRWRSDEVATWIMERPRAA